MDREELAELAERYGTPLTVLDLRRVRSNVERISTALSRELGPASKPHYALKSCYLPGVVEEVTAAGWGVEVMSGFELDLALAAGVPGEDITLTGLGWGADACRAAVAAGVGRYVADSEADLAELARAAAGTSPLVFARANVADQLPGTFLEPYGKLGQTGDDLHRAFDAVRTAFPRAGLHLHQFNRLTDPVPYEDALARFARLARGLRVDHVDIGGGVESLSRLDAAGAPVEVFAAAAGRHFGTGFGTVATEFGRAVVGDAGVAVGRVTAVKRTRKATWVVLDVPANTVVPIPGAVFPPTSLHSGARPAESCSFTDGTGSPFSYAEDVPFPRPEVGDLVCLTEAGAYTTVFTELWAAPLPTTVIIDHHGARVRDGAGLTRHTLHSWYAAQAFPRVPADRRRPAAVPGTSDRSDHRDGS